MEGQEEEVEEEEGEEKGAEKTMGGGRGSYLFCLI